MTVRRCPPLPLLAAVAALLSLCAPLGAEEEALTARQIVEKATALSRAEDEHIVSRAEIIDATSRRTRELEVFIKAGEGQDDKILVRFTDPAPVRGTAMLTLEHSDRADDQWVYIPALRKTKRVATGDKGGSFAGTDFAYEDIRTEDMARTRYERLPDAEIDGRACYVIAASPAAPEASAYSKRVLRIRKDGLLVVEVDFFDKVGTHVKTLLAGDYVEVKGLWRANRLEMRDVVRGSRTLWSATGRRLNEGLSDSLFTKRSLESS